MSVTGRSRDSVYLDKESFQRTPGNDPDEYARGDFWHPSTDAASCGLGGRTWEDDGNHGDVPKIDVVRRWMVVHTFASMASRTDAWTEQMSALSSAIAANAGSMITSSL